jgi:glutathione S-transferase
MERQLRIAPYLVGQNYTVVDIFLYAYTPIRMWQMKVGSTYQPFRQ